MPRKRAAQKDAVRAAGWARLEPSTVDAANGTGGRDAVAECAADGTSNAFGEVNA